MSLVDLTAVSFAYGRGRTVLEGVDLRIEAGRNLGIVGESGSGKTTLLRLLLGLARPSSGRISFRGAPLDPGDRSFMRGFRRAVQAVFQDPYSSLDPRQRIADIVAEPLRSLKIATDVDAAVAEALASVDLPLDAAGRYPHEFSGGQRQRICIARALSLKPKLIVADESVAALDVSVRAKVLDLMLELQETEGLAYLFISHDMAVIERMSHDVAVMNGGRIVEYGPRRSVFENPEQDYTRRLIAAVPIPDPSQRRLAMAG